MTNVLIVEDESEYAKILGGLVGDKAQCFYAINAERASELINNSFFDLIILDLNIPLNSDPRSTISPNHGHTIFSLARSVCPGTPIIVLTGSSAEDFIGSLVDSNTKIDLWGNSQDMSMVSFHTKHKLDTFPILLNTYLNALGRISGVELDKNNIDLSNEEDRLLRIFALKYKGVKVEVSKISGGLSSAKVYRLRLTSGSGGVILNSICKIGSKEIIKSEHVNYDSFISRLTQEATPRKLAIIEHGAKNHAAVFYSLANGFGYSMFDKLHNENEISEIVTRVANLLSNWNAHSETRVRIIDIRSMLLTDAELTSLNLNLPWIDAFEKNEIQVKMGCAHCDLHGFNILISDQNIPVLIDYGDVANAPASLDPLTLELCIHYHPDSQYLNTAWPTIEQAKRWYNLDIYIENCPCPAYIIACRDWATRTAAGKRELAAGAYSYFLRQLKYPNVNLALTHAFIEGARNLYNET